MTKPENIPTEPEDDDGEAGGATSDPYDDDFDGKQD